MSRPAFVKVRNGEFDLLNDAPLTCGNCYFLRKAVDFGKRFGKQGTYLRVIGC
jgi:hypothetical protein